MISKIQYKLFGWDFIGVIIYAYIGRLHHGLFELDSKLVYSLILPFGFAYFLMAFVGRLYSQSVYINVKRTITRILSLWIIGSIIAVTLRALVLQKEIPEGIPLVFLLVVYITGITFFCLSRLIFIYFFIPKVN